MNPYDIKIPPTVRVIYEELRRYMQPVLEKQDEGAEVNQKLIKMSAKISDKYNNGSQAQCLQAIIMLLQREKLYANGVERAGDGRTIFFDKRTIFQSLLALNAYVSKMEENNKLVPLGVQLYDGRKVYEQIYAKIAPAKYLEGSELQLFFSNPASKIDYNVGVRAVSVYQEVVVKPFESPSKIQLLNSFMFNTQTACYYVDIPFAVSNL